MPRNKSQNVTQAADPVLDAPHMIEHVAEIGSSFLVKARQVEVHKLIAKFGHRPKDALKAGELTPQRKEPGDVLTGKKGIECAMLHCQHFLLDLVDDRHIAVDDEVENGVEHIIHAMPQLRRGSFQLAAQLRVRTCRSVAHVMRWFWPIKIAVSP